MRPALALAFALAFALVPSAGAAVSVDAIVAPERTMAEKPFPVSVRLTNDGEARDVYLFGALYRREPGKAPCGPATDESFRTFTHTYNEAVRLPARSTIMYPDDGTWLHRYRAEHVRAEPDLAELCIFVANASTGPLIQYEDFATAPLSVRAVNAPPVASFTWEPQNPRAGEDVAFAAQGEDADGDPVTFRWDFGHLNASGRAVAQGPAPTTFFYPAGEYVVTLYASDGLEEADSRSLVKIAMSMPTRAEEGEGAGVPLPWWILLLAGAAAIGIRRRGRT